VSAPADHTSPRDPRHRVVALGASAGGVEALVRVVAALPDAPGFMVVVLTHLDPSQPTRLDQVLQEHTKMPVAQIPRRCAIEHDRVYVLPANASAIVLDGHLCLRARPAGVHLPIDAFLASMAQDGEVKGAAAILSGTGSDGAAGILDLKADGGYVLAQRPETAAHDGMPRAAIETGVVDQVLSPEEMPSALAAYFALPVPLDRPDTPDDGDHLKAALAAIREASGLDLSYVKEVNLQRRLMRRVLMHPSRDLATYLKVLADDPAEANALRDDILIGVTAFFRDPDFVRTLRETVVPTLLSRRDDTIRVWVPACSTGEEVYTIAIVLQAELARRRSSRPVQIFGTDINERSIAVARRARYSAAALDNVPDEYRDGAFMPDGEDFVVAKPIRAMCIFARHSLVTNSPFSGMDLVSCRNLLIYLRKEAQAHVLAVLHYALKADGALLLGRSESVSDESLFHDTGTPHLYAKNPLSPRSGGRLLAVAASHWTGNVPDGRQPHGSAPPMLQTVVNELLCAHYVPSGFVVDESGDVVQFRGDTAPFMAPASGDATLSVTRLVRPEWRVPLRTALIEAARTGQVVRRDGALDPGGAFTMEVLPITAREGTRYFAITIQQHAAGEAGAAVADAHAASGGVAAAREHELERTIEALSEELERARAELRVVVAEFEAANEELRTSNEEVLSANEELQSANEELQNAKQRHESANEELNSLNQELLASNVQLTQANDDLNNLIEGIPLPVLLLDRELCIRQASPLAQAMFGLSSASIGRGLDVLAARLDTEPLRALLDGAIRDLTPGELELTDADGRWFLARARAYRTADHRINGAVLTLEDVDALKKSLETAQAARAEAERANTAKNDFLALVSHELRAPLNAIAGWAAVLERLAPDMPKGGPGGPAERAISTITRNCQVQAQLIDDLLDVARITSGRLTLDLRHCDFAASVRAVLDGLRPAAEAKKITILESGLARERWVNADPRRLQQMVSNLLQNAIKFTPRGGHIEVAALTFDGVIELSVADDGIGMSAAQLAAAFDRFAQKDLAKTREYGGLGLGLSIVQHLVTAHGGGVTAHSAGEGRGARFVLRLPLVIGAPSDGHVLAPPAELDTALDGTSILLVDDEADGRESLAAILELAGAECTTVDSASRALGEMETQAFDALVSDIAMPGMTGLDLVRTLRARERREQLPRLYAMALTGFASVRDRDEALDSGFDDHAAKPIDAAALVERLAAGLRRNGTRPQRGEAAAGDAAPASVPAS
jgi:two-component system CheB/CheR fusion protein